MSNCQCEYHMKWWKWETEIREALSGEPLEKFDVLIERYHNIEMEFHALQAVFDGSWPSAVPQLEFALERAKYVQTGNVVSNIDEVRRCRCNKGILRPSILDEEEGLVLSCNECGLVLH